jgi:DNA-binding transcriptional MerR regulator
MARSETKGGRKAGERSRKPAGSPKAAEAESKETPPEPPDGGKLYYRIGEVSRMTGVKPYVLRYWESEFRWMSPQKSRSKQRLYRPKDIETIQLIKKLLYEERYTIAGARQKVRELVAAGEVQDWLRGRDGGKPGGKAGSKGRATGRKGAADTGDDGSPMDLIRGLREELRSIREALEA